MQYPLTPHAYPWWIKIASVMCFVFFIISMTDLPYLFEIDSKIKKAQEAFLNKNYWDARSQYIDLALSLPDNKRLKKRAAELLFLSSQKVDHMLALRFLEKISLDKDEWKELLTYMPRNYISMFKRDGSRIVKK